jgi:pimeloyl-ACP methyl ester carboxylesterase
MPERGRLAGMRPRTADVTIALGLFVLGVLEATFGFRERMLVDVLRATYTDTYPLDEDWARRTAAESYDRHPPDPAARQRQLAAGRATTTPEGGLARITAPTLVIHGGADPLIRPAASRALARAIPGARLVTYPGMGHGLPPGLWSAVLDEISTLVEQHNPPAATPGSQR